MDLESADGSRIPLERGSSMEIGRELGLGLGFGPVSSDPTVSRRHLSLRLPDDVGSRVLFEVIGRNPVMVCSSRGNKRVYRRSEKGELEEGDRISLSLKNPSFFVLKGRRGEEPAAAEADEGVLDAVERRKRRTMERRKGMKKEKEREEEFGGEEESKEAFTGELEAGLESLDVSHIDPVQEFGFLVRGHEFDQYPRKKIRPAKDWNWFLDETKEESDEDDGYEVKATGSKGKGRRKKSGGGDEDEEWTGESADEKDLVTSGGSAKRPKYTTRSKDPKNPRNGASFGGKPAPEEDVKVGNDELDEEDEGDETLGGFIVDEEEVDEQEEEEEEEEEEELEDEEESD